VKNKKLVPVTKDRSFKRVKLIRATRGDPFLKFWKTIESLLNKYRLL
jgi:hypothetical protein